MVTLLTVTQWIAGSTPVYPANESVAQLVEHLTVNQKVIGSSPIGFANGLQYIFSMFN